MVYTLLQEAFQNSGLSKDFYEIGLQTNIDSIIDNEDRDSQNIGQHVSSKYNSPRRQISFKAKRGAVYKRGEFSQAQVATIIRNLYLGTNYKGGGKVTSDYQDYH
jgi:hypothetical protein